MLEQLSAFLLYLAVVSMAAERFTDIIKRAFMERFSVDHMRGSAYQIIAAVFGFTLALISPPDVDLFTFGKYTEAVIVGLAVSGGSGMWNSILSVVNDFSKASKTN